MKKLELEKLSFTQRKIKRFKVYESNLFKLKMYEVALTTDGKTVDKSYWKEFESYLKSEYLINKDTSFPGIYITIKNTNNKFKIYIGESDNVLNRFSRQAQGHFKYMTNNEKNNDPNISNEKKLKTGQWSTTEGIAFDKALVFIKGDTHLKLEKKEIDKLIWRGPFGKDELHEQEANLINHFDNLENSLIKLDKKNLGNRIVEVTNKNKGQAKEGGDSASLYEKEITFNLIKELMSLTDMMINNNMEDKSKNKRIYFDNELIANTFDSWTKKHGNNFILNPKIKNPLYKDLKINFEISLLKTKDSKEKEVRCILKEGSEIKTLNAAAPSRPGYESQMIAIHSDLDYIQKNEKGISILKKDYEYDSPSLPLIIATGSDSFNAYDALVSEKTGKTLRDIIEEINDKNKQNT